MTASSASHLSYAKIRRLLAAVGSVPAEQELSPQVSEHDWRNPHYFDEDQCNRLAAIMSQVAVGLGETFTRFHGCEFTVTPSSVTQCFAAELSALSGPQEKYYLMFGPDPEHACGCLVIAAETAVRWVTRLLGDTEPAEAGNRPLSALEESLLYDLAAAVVEALLTPVHPDHTLRPDDRLRTDHATIAFEPTQEICTLAFGVGKSDSNDSDKMDFLLPCRMLAPLVGKDIQEIVQGPSEELSRNLLEHVQQMPITVTARLASTKLSFEALLDLGCGDILLLDRSIDGLLELALDGQVLFRGRPVRSGGQHAVWITESAADPAQQTVSSPAMH
jgi:flagellar motor switch protein FliM